MMKKNILLAILSFIVVSNSLMISQHQVSNPNSIIVGGYSPISTVKLSNDAKEVDQFIRSKHPDLQGATLISAETQVVAGLNYRFKYISADGEREWDIVVYKNLKGKLLENGFNFNDTLPNGQKVKATGDTSSAFVEANKPVPSIKVSAKAIPSSLPTLTSKAQKNQAKSGGNDNGNRVKTYLNIFPNAISPKPAN